MTQCLAPVFLVGLAISKCISTTPHPMNRARGSILFVLYSMIFRLAHHFMFLVAVERYNHLAPVFVVGSNPTKIRHLKPTNVANIV